MKVAGICRVFLNHMTRLQKFFTKFQDEGYSKWIFIVPSAILLALLALPLASLVLRSINSELFENAFSDQSFKALKISLLTSSTTTAIAAVLGTPLAFIMARWRIKHKSWIEMILDLPIVLPPSVAGLALLIAFGRRGLFGSTLGIFGVSLPFTTAAVVLAQIFVSAPLYVRSARIGFAQIDIQLEESAHVEGANQWQVFSEVMIPLTRRALVSGAILTWTRALGEFGATILFAGNLEGVTQTMPMAIYLGFERNLGVAVALSVVLIVVSVILLMVTKKLEKHED
jgi:molybdate transport system permease protein